MPSFNMDFLGWPFGVCGGFEGLSGVFAGGELFFAGTFWMLWGSSEKCTRNTDLQ